VVNQGKESRRGRKPLEGWVGKGGWNLKKSEKEKRKRTEK
jgi:hypothetical protein